MKQEIIECEEKLLQGLRTSNFEIVEDLIHDKVIYNHASGKVLTKQMDVDDFKSSNPKIEKLECIEREIEVFGDTAILTTELYLKGVFGDHPVEGKTRFLRTWKKFENGWKIVAAASINL
ncbi:MAG: nuclear transport factor 2 family protein [Dysgonomonas sp.]